MTARLSPGDIDRIRARLEHSRSAKGTGDEVALDFALARDACALSAHCIAVEASRVAIRCFNLVGGASYFRCTDNQGWCFDDDNQDSDGVRYTRVEAARRARALGPAHERPYAPLEERALEAIAARAAELATTTEMATRAAVTKALVNDLPSLLGHAASLDEDIVAISSVFLETDFGDVERDEETGEYRYEDFYGVHIGRGLDFDEALRRALFVMALPEDSDGGPEWLLRDRAEHAELRRIEKEDDAREEAERANVLAEQERIEDEQREVEYARLKVEMKRPSRYSLDRIFTVSQADFDAVVTLTPISNASPRDSSEWTAKIGEHERGGGTTGWGDSPAMALRDAVDRLHAPDPEFGGRDLRDPAWPAILEAIVAFGPFPSAKEQVASFRAHDARMRELGAKITPDLTRVLAEHGLEVEWALPGDDDDGQGEIRVRLKTRFPQ